MGFGHSWKWEREAQVVYCVGLLGHKWTTVVVPTAEWIIGDDVLYACSVNNHKRQREFSCSGTSTGTVLPWLVQQKQYVNPDGKRENSALAQGIMTVRVGGEAIFQCNSTTFQTQPANTAPLSDSATKYCPSFPLKAALDLLPSSCWNWKSYQAGYTHSGMSQLGLNKTKWEGSSKPVLSNRNGVIWVLHEKVAVISLGETLSLPPHSTAWSKAASSVGPWIHL